MTRFPVGYHALHEDISVNFQLNRFWNWVGEPQMLEELRAAGSRIHSYDDLTRELLALGEQALAEQRLLPGAYLLRTAEFFMRADDPRRRPTRERFVEIVRGVFEIRDDAHQRIPYDGAQLNAYRLTSASPGEHFVIFGGFDSYIEEWFPFLLALQAAGLDVVAFDGSGQGAVLEQGMPMTADLHRPVAAVLDHFALQDVAMLGFSLGGCLVLRAAAHEPRVTRVIAQDVLSDFSECFLRPLSGARRALAEHADRVPDTIINPVIEAARRHDLFTDWGIGEAMRVLGAVHPAEVFKTIRAFRTDDVSPLVTQDVLLLAGARDHYVPVHQLGDQLETLTSARSVSARLFTEAEHAQNHCQVGNLGLALEVILEWLETVSGAKPTPRHEDGDR